MHYEKLSVEGGGGRLQVGVVSTSAAGGMMVYLHPVLAPFVVVKDMVGNAATPPMVGVAVDLVGPLKAEAGVVRAIKPVQGIADVELRVQGGQQRQFRGGQVSHVAAGQEVTTAGVNRGLIQGGQVRVGGAVLLVPGLGDHKGLAPVGDGRAHVSLPTTIPLMLAKVASAGVGAQRVMGVPANKLSGGDQATTAAGFPAEKVIVPTIVGAPPMTTVRVKTAVPVEGTKAVTEVPGSVPSKVTSRL
jgi:hypothetical protein